MAPVGPGLAYLPEDSVRPLLAAVHPLRVVEDWYPPFPGYHLCYPSRRQQTRALTLLVDELRWRG